MALLIYLALAFQIGAGQLTETARHAALKQAYAIDFLNPSAHMALAKYHHDRGNRLLAFYISEAARRGYFEEQQFNEAFNEVFLGKKPLDSSDASVRKLVAKHAKEPRNLEVSLELATIAVSRHDWPNAKKYLQAAIAIKPEAYVNYDALAEVYRRAGDEDSADELINSFYTKFPESVEALEHVIVPLISESPSKAKSLLKEAMELHPENGALVFNNAILMQKLGGDQSAEREFMRAAELGKQNAQIQGWTGRFFLASRKNKDTSIKYYLNAYFLDPHFYDTEFAESRIRSLNYELARIAIDKWQAANKPLELLLEDDNPVVVDFALAELAKTWNSTTRQHVIVALSHDDMNIRVQAIDILKKHPEQEVKKAVRVMLNSSDANMPGLGCYLAMHFWKDKGVQMIAPLISHKSQLVRYDVVSALLQNGGKEGRRIVKEHLQQETHPTLRKMITSAVQERPEQP